MVDVRETGLVSHVIRPALHRLALDLDASAAAPAGQMVVVGVGPAPPVPDFAAGVADRVELAGLGQRLQMPVDSGEPDLLAARPELGVDLLRAGEAGQPAQHGGHSLGLPGTAHPGALWPRAIGWQRGSHSRTVAASGVRSGRPATGQPRLSG